MVIREKNPSPPRVYFLTFSLMTAFFRQSVQTKQLVEVESMEFIGYLHRLLRLDFLIQTAGITSCFSVKTDVLATSRRMLI